MHEQDQNGCACESRHDLCAMLGNAASQDAGHSDIEHAAPAIGEDVYKIAPGHFRQSGCATCVSRARCSASSALLRRTGTVPNAVLGTAPALRRTAPQGLRAAPRPGNEVPVSRARCSASSALLRRTGTVPNTVLGTAPALRRTAPQVLRAAPRPGHEVPVSRARCSASSALLRRTGTVPNAVLGTAPALRRTAPQGLRAAPRPGNDGA